MTVRKWPEAVQAVINKLQPQLESNKALHDRLFGPEKMTQLREKMQKQIAEIPVYSDATEVQTYGWPVIAEIQDKPREPVRTSYGWHMVELYDGIYVYQVDGPDFYHVETIGM